MKLVSLAGLAGALLFAGSAGFCGNILDLDIKDAGFDSRAAAGHVCVTQRGNDKDDGHQGSQLARMPPAPELPNTDELPPPT